MATHIMNKVGSANITLPSKISKHDILRFNITNSDVNTKYNGTLMTYTFPFDCKTRLECVGARGGKGNRATDTQVGWGARACSNFEFKKGDTLLILIGQAGTDFSGSYSDGTSGAGGGGTFVMLKSTDGTGDTYTGTGTGNGWKVKPLIIASGGNGSQDVGYSGVGTIYHGQGVGGTSPNYSDYSGGGYNGYSGSTKSGKSFLEGGQGATAKYTRNSFSVAGFGCGGGNADDGAGGGGGGYHGGVRGSKSAYSFIATNGENNSVESGYNFGEGYLQIQFLEVKGSAFRVNVNGNWKESISSYVNVNGNWKEIIGIHTNVNGTWKESV